MDTFLEAKKKNKQNEFTSFLVELIKVLKVETYVELGVQKGYTFNQISPLVKLAVAVDIKPFVIVHPNVVVRIMTTVEFSKQWKDPIDFLFIDACHKKEFVLEDFGLFSPFVKEDTGMIALHDTCPAYEELLQDDFCSNAWEAAAIIRNDPNFETVSIPSKWAGLTLVRKSTKQLWWKK